MNIDDLDNHPDLRDLRLSKKDEREARAEGRRRQRQASGAGPSFLRRHRTAVVVVIALVVLIVAAVVLMDRTRPRGTETPPPSLPPTNTDQRATVYQHVW